TKACKVRLAGVTLTSTNGPAVSMISAERNFVVTDAGTSNVLTDSASYTRTGSGALYASGPLILSGAGDVSITGIKSHAIYGGSYIRVLGGRVKVPAAVKDAVHSKTLYQQDAGTLDLTATGDGIDGDTGSVVINGGSLSIRSVVDDTKGIACDGTLTINGGALNLTLNGVQSKGLTSGGNLTVAGGSVVMNLAGGVFLESVTSGTTTYVDPSYCTGLKSKGNISFTGGSVTLTHTGTAGKGVSASGNVSVAGGVLDLVTTGGASTSYTNSKGVADTAAADCLKADGTLVISSGTVTASSSGAGGDCLSSDLGLTISGGNVNLTSSGASGDCVASDTTVTVSGGVVGVTVKGAQAKGMKSGGDMSILGGALAFTMSGAVVLEQVTGTTRYDPSYCTTMKCDGNLTVSNGTIAVTHTGQAGKGISADGNILITGGTLNLATSGANTATFTNTSGVTDLASADCLKADGNLTITGGTITAASTGNAADAISCDGVAIIGVLGNDTSPVITASTTGAKVLVTGSGNSADYANAKAFKAGGNLTMNGGIFRATTQQDGGEGMESKANLTIAGGLVEITSYDDAINASTSVNISGGKVYCYSTGNDGIDSNGTFHISGGIIVSSGSNSPEEGFDCDNNQFKITGGILIGSGGATSTPTASVNTQRTILYKGTGTLNTIVQLKTS
ncbi:MAG: carbohydrate-binding domain-containing protein, partial [Verrucomicrobiaceae bacterium]